LRFRREGDADRRGRGLAGCAHPAAHSGREAMRAAAGADTTREIHVERLLGTHVRDSNDHKVGRLEEFRCENHDGYDVVVEYHIGPAAILERVGVFISKLPLLEWLPWSRWEYRVPWQDAEIVSSRELRLRVPRESLQRVAPDAPD